MGFQRRYRFRLCYVGGDASAARRAAAREAPYVKPLKGERARKEGMKRMKEEMGFYERVCLESVGSEENRMMTTRTKSETYLKLGIFFFDRHSLRYHETKKNVELV